MGYEPISHEAEGRIIVLVIVLVIVSVIVLVIVSVIVLAIIVLAKSN